jgi:hypothetical protein
MPRATTSRIIKRIFVFACGMVMVPVVWTALSLFFARVLTSASSASPEELRLSDEAVFKISTQSLLISADEGARSAVAVMAWIKETDLFFTNHHVVNGICNKTGACRFESRDAFDFLPVQRELKKRICLPGRDICVLTPEGKVPSVKDSELASASVGQKVYYVDREASRLRLYEGEVTAVDRDLISVKGYGRHGFSGTPLFNQEGQIVGIMSSGTAASHLLLPHYLIFGWTPMKSFLAVSVADSRWMLREQEELNRSEWATALHAISHDLPATTEGCASLWARWAAIYRFGMLVMTWSDSFDEPPLSEVMQRLETVSGSQDLCSKIVLEGEAVLTR